MGRFFAPLLAYAAAAYVFWKNAQTDSEFLFLFPLNNIFEDPAVAGARSWQLLLLLGTLWLFNDIRSWMAARTLAAEAAKSEAE